jgi:hypothetical protein
MLVHCSQEDGETGERQECLLNVHGPLVPYEQTANFDEAR